MSRNWIIGEEITAKRLNDTGFGWKVVAQDTPNMTVRVNPGVAIVDGSTVKFAGGNSPTITAPAANPRIDLITVDSAGTIAVTNGAENASPTAPAYPVNKTVLAEIYSRVGMTEIVDVDTSGKGYIYRDTRALGAPVVLIDTSTGTPDAAKGIKTNAKGKIDKSFLMPDVLYIQTSITGSNMTAMYSDDPYVLMSSNNGMVFVSAPGIRAQARTWTSDWASATNILGVAKVGSYLYVLYRDTTPSPDTMRVYRYDYTNLAAGGTQMSFSGATVLIANNNNVALTSDGTNIFLSYNAGNSANAYVIAKYSISGTTLTYVASITCGSTAFGFDAANGGYAVLTSGDIYTIDVSGMKLHKFNSSGTQQYAEATNTRNTKLERLCNIADTLYCHSITTNGPTGVLVKLTYE